MKRTIERIVEYVVNIAEPEEIILFGSLAGGAPDMYSDIDLLIVTKNPVLKKEAVARIRSFTEAYCLKTDVLIYTKEELDAEINIPFSFLSAIIKTGKTIFKK